MARNNHPEVTIKRILDTATQLFLQKGYDNTTIQDIIDALGNLSKGAIYHHFKSKEDIFLAIDARYETALLEIFHETMELEGLTGLEKLRRLMRINLDSPAQRELLQVIPNLLDNPRFLALQVRSTLEEVAPLYLEPLIRLGIQDGSIHSEDPHELAEVLAVLFNVWINPILWHVGTEVTHRKMAYLMKLLNLLGLPLLDDELISSADWMLDL